MYSYISIRCVAGTVLKILGTPQSEIAKRARPENKMQMMIAPTKLIQHQRDLRELEGI